MTEQDLRVIDMMVRYGGSFVKHLGEAAKFADGDNLARIKRAFPEYWKSYSEMVPATPKDEPFCYIDHKTGESDHMNAHIRTSKCNG